MIAGTTVLYLIEPKQNPFLLFTALAMVCGAIAFDMLIQVRHDAEKRPN